MFFKALRTKEKLLFAIDKSDLNIKAPHKFSMSLYPVPNFVENGYVMEDLMLFFLLKIASPVSCFNLRLLILKDISILRG